MNRETWNVFIPRTIETGARTVVSNANPTRCNEYKVELVKALVPRAVLQAA